MGLISRMRRQFAVYWAPNGSDDFGNPKYAAPVEIRCRWEDVSVLFVETKTQAQAVSNAHVYVDREVELDGVLWKGRLADLSVPGTIDPLNDEEAAFTIRKFGSTPNLKATENLLEAWV